MGATASDSPGMSSRALRSRRSLRREVDRLTALADENQTRLLERERELEEQQRILRNLHARQAMILRMEREVAGSRNPFHAAEAAAGAARMVSGARRVAIWLLDDEGGRSGSPRMPTQRPRTGPTPRTPTRRGLRPVPVSSAGHSPRASRWRRPTATSWPGLSW